MRDQEKGMEPSREEGVEGVVEGTEVESLNEKILNVDEADLDELEQASGGTYTCNGHCTVFI